MDGSKTVMDVNQDEDTNTEINQTTEQELNEETVTEPTAIVQQETNETEVNGKKDKDLFDVSTSKVNDMAVIDNDEADMLRAAIAVEESIDDNGDTRDAPLPVAPSFSDLECVQFQSHLFQLVEELRMRREIDDENKEKIKQLVKAQQQIETKYDEAVERTRRQQIDAEEKVADKKKSTHTEITDLQLQKTRLVSTCEMREQEIKALKDEIRALQLSCCNAEQRASELDRAAQLQRCAHASQHGQLTLAEQTTQKLKAEVQELGLVQQRLRMQVSEAEKINRQLSSIVLHQRCIERAQSEQIAQSRDELVALRVQLGKSEKTADNSSDDRLTINHLQRLIKMHVENEKSLNEKLEVQAKEQQKASESLHEAHTLLDRQSQGSGEQRERAETAEARLKTVRQLYADTDTELTGCRKKMDEMEQVHQSAEVDWKLQETSLMSRLHSLEHDHEHLMKTHVDMEQLNSEWAMRNVHLNEELAKLKADQNKVKSDVGLQSTAEMLPATSQTDFTQLVSQQAQTDSIQLLSQHAQTDRLMNQDTPTQTEELYSAQNEQKVEKINSTECLSVGNVGDVLTTSDLVSCEKSQQDVETCSADNDKLEHSTDLDGASNGRISLNCGENKENLETKMETNGVNSPYKFQFVSQVPPANTTSIQVVSEDNSTTTMLKGIIQDVSLPKAKRVKRVSFSVSPPGKSYPQLHEASPQKVRNAADRNEEDLFSDGEQMDFELGSQLERIQHILQ